LDEFYSVQLAAAREAETGEGYAEERAGRGLGDSCSIQNDGASSGVRGGPRNLDSGIGGQSAPENGPVARESRARDEQKVST
jgi:hypothetical protein